MTEVSWDPRTWESEEAKAEHQAWVDACWASMCARNWRGKGSPVPIPGVELNCQCEHQWCQAVIDVINRRMFERF